MNRIGIVYMGLYGLGLHILHIEYSCDADYVLWKWSNEQKIHHTKIHYETRVPYFLCNGRRVSFGNIQRIDEN